MTKEAISQDEILHQNSGELQRGDVRLLYMNMRDVYLEHLRRLPWYEKRSPVDTYPLKAMDIYGQLVAEDRDATLSELKIYADLGKDYGDADAADLIQNRYHGYECLITYSDHTWLSAYLKQDEEFTEGIGGRPSWLTPSDSSPQAV